ncbi:hypothetical protein [Pseudoduganella lutea]|uniref:Uncharacterized protein n=1 Tax=Pseudoduganella lutea TaxID=321985 RepID=A0A4P6KTU4_9BURK|nr:hypothetical protein [Pseudoduganella lutea]QBE62330.1 hypothetical protein EWM63_04490 [Pseudoduganella lutea]
MNRLLWGWLIAAGLLLARIAHIELGSGEPAAAGTAGPQLTVLVMLTGGLLIGLIGITGLLGLLGWVPRPGRK